MNANHVLNPKFHRSFRRLRFVRFGIWSLGFGILFLAPVTPAAHSSSPRTNVFLLDSASFAQHIERFNKMENENRTNFVSNAQSWDWIKTNIPFFECPDREVEEIYYFRWWSFRKHLVQTTNGFVLTEFLVPIRHAGAFNTISCASGHHLAEGRWLKDHRYLDDYSLFWLRGAGGRHQPHFHKYSSWFAAAVYDRFLVNQDRDFVVGLLDDLVADYRLWEKERQLPSGLFWQYDVQDGMEESISGSRTSKNIRPTINSYMHANSRAIRAIAELAGNKELAKEFENKAFKLKRSVETELWNAEAQFFEVRRASGEFAGVREQIGFIPWLFALPSPGREIAWKQLTDPEGFLAPYGITTAERRHQGFRSHGCCRCEWDGAVWPFATSQTLGALANVVRDYPQSFVSANDYFAAFLAYVRSHRFEGKPYLGEYLDETTGQWLKGRQERSRYYNHSTFADLVITGVVGLRPRPDDVVEIHPLLPQDTWDWFCLDGVRYHGRTLTIAWDAKGERYRQGRGLFVLVDGKEIARSDKLSKLTAKLP